MDNGLKHTIEELAKADVKIVRLKARVAELEEALKETNSAMLAAYNDVTFAAGYVYQLANKNAALLKKAAQ